MGDEWKVNSCHLKPGRRDLSMITLQALRHLGSSCFTSRPGQLEEPLLGELLALEDTAGDFACFSLSYMGMKD